MIRDKKTTKTKIVDAFGQCLAQEGFRGVGLRSVAREAGIDKRLIYRYFGGLPGLMKAYAFSADFWWTVDELIGDDLPGPSHDTPAEWISLALRRHAQALRRRPLTQEILVWELSERNALTDELSAIREQRGAELIQQLSKKWGVTGAPEWIVAGALLISATTYLVIRARTCDFYAGIDLRTEQGWAEIEHGIDFLVKGVFAPSAA